MGICLFRKGSLCGSLTLEPSSPGVHLSLGILSQLPSPVHFQELVHTAADKGPSVLGFLKTCPGNCSELRASLHRSLDELNQLKIKCAHIFQKISLLFWLQESNGAQSDKNEEKHA